MIRSLLFTLACVSISFGETVTLTPSKDSDIYSYTDIPPSSLGTLGVNSSGAGSPHSQRSLIQFDLATMAIPSDQIGRATLRLYVLKPETEFGSGISPGNVVIHRQGQAWTITNPILRWAKTDPKELVATLPITTNLTDSWVEIDVTTLVKTWTSGAQPNYGFLLMPESETATPWVHVDFAAMELSVAGVAPQLRIERAIVPPVLSISHAGGTLTLEWPVSGSEGWFLQRAESPAGPWSGNSATLSTAAGKWLLNFAPGLPKEFFRLARN